jgi:hypothetical protein
MIIAPNLGETTHACGRPLYRENESVAETDVSSKTETCAQIELARNRGVVGDRVQQRDARRFRFLRPSTKNNRGYHGR